MTGSGKKDIVFDAGTERCVEKVADVLGKRIDKRFRGRGNYMVGPVYLYEDPRRFSERLYTYTGQTPVFLIGVLESPR